MPLFLETLGPAVFAFALGVTLLSGFVKGAVGFAMPLVMVSGMGILIAPELVVAGIVLPIVVSNIMQVLHAGLGLARQAIKDHWRYVLLVCVMILIATQFVRQIPSDLLFIMLGVVVVSLCFIQLIGWRPRIPLRWRNVFEWVAGTFAGILGGLAGTWGPPTVLYLLALEIPRERQMAIQGVIYGLGSVMLFLGHLRSGILNTETLAFSASLVPAALIGMWLGFRLGEKFDQEKFRTMVLIVLMVAGANLIRRGLIG